MHLSKRVCLVAAWAGVAAAGGASSALGADAGVQIVRGAAISAKIEGMPPSVGGRGGMIVRGDGWRVFAAERDVPGLAELHDHETDVWYVMAGGATVVTGGTIVEPTLTEPGEHRGPAIRGGKEHTVAAGDVVTIPPGVAHWVKAVDGRLRYLVVKVPAAPAAGSRPR